MWTECQINYRSLNGNFKDSVLTVRLSIDGRFFHLYVTRCSSIAERPRCRKCYSFGQKWKTGTGQETIFYGHYRSTFNHCDIIGLKIYRIRFVTIHAFDRQTDARTDGQTDSFLIAIQRLHFMQRCMLLFDVCRKESLVTRMPGHGFVYLCHCVTSH